MTLNNRVTSFCIPYCDVIHSPLNKEYKIMSEQKRIELTRKLAQERLKAAIEYAKYLADNHGVYNKDYWDNYDTIQSM